MTVVCGIDIGHDSVRVAVLTGGRPVMVAMLPAWVAFDGANVLVGAEARELPWSQRIQPRAWLARAAGTADRQALITPAGLAHPIVEGAAHAPAELVAWLLRPAIAAVEADYGPVFAAVIAVPVQAGVIARRTLSDAAVLAGIPVVRFCSEPVLASLSLNSANGARWLICDAGAGEFTASVVTFGDGVLQRLSSEASAELGGEALDHAIGLELARELEGGVTDDNDGLVLRSVARIIKELPAATVETAVADALIGTSLANRRLRVPRKDEVELWTAPWLRRLDEVCGAALAAAAVQPSDLTEVVLIGGGARSPLMVRRLVQILDRTPQVPTDVGFAVVQGAALAAGMFVADSPVLLIDVVPRGVLLGSRDDFAPIIPAGSVLPTRGTRVFSTSELNQVSIEVELWEDSLPPRAIGRYRIGGLPAAPAGDALALCVVAMDANGLPTLTATEFVSGAVLSVTPLIEAGLGVAELAQQRLVMATSRA